MIIGNQFRQYPMDAFYVLAADAANEVASNTQTPTGMVGMEFLLDMAVTTQGLYDVELPTGQLRPTSLSLAIIAESGERTSGVHNLVAAPIYEFDEERESLFETRKSLFEAEYAAWSAVDAGLRRALTRAAQDEEPTEGLQEKLMSNMEQRPIKPKKRRVIRQNISERATMEALEGDGEMLGIISDEMDTLDKGGLFERIGTYNKAWDGPKMMTYDRGNGLGIVARNPRVTVAFKAHPEMLQDLLSRRGSVMRGSGHWARYLIGYPESTQGTRFVSTLEKTWVNLPKFHERMRELLKEYGRRLDVGAMQRQVLTFSEDAKRQWIGYSNDVERMLQPLGYLHDIKDCASKSMELMGRVAALLHVFSRQEGQITVDCLQRAMRIVEWHIFEFKALFSPECRIPQDQIDAQTLQNYLHRRYWCAGFGFSPKNDVLKSGPLRPSSRFEDALWRLVNANVVCIRVNPKGQKFIELNPQVFGAIRCDVTPLLL